MPEPLILKIQADTKGVPEGMNQITRAQDNMQISSRKASTAIKGLVQDLSQAKSGADVASAALGAFSRILGSSIAATAIAIAGKTVIDTFTKIGEVVDQTRERISTASQDIKKSGLDISFTQAAGEAKRLSDEADNARKNIEKLDKSFLQGLVATITGAREELGKLAKEAEELAQQRLFEGARAERMRAEERVGLEGGQLAIKDIEERLMRELQGVDLTTPTGIRTATELRKRAEIDIAKVRQDAADKFDIERAKQELKLIDAQIEGRRAAEKMSADSDYKRSEDDKKREEELLKERAKIEKDLLKRKEKLEKDSIDLRIDQSNLEERLSSQKRQALEAEARVAQATLGSGGSMRGPGQRPTSAEVGAAKRAEHAGRQEEYRQMQAERQRIKEQITQERADQAAREGGFFDPAEVSQFDVNRRLEETLKQAAMDEAKQKYQDAAAAREGAGATEQTLKDVRDHLQKVLDELKTYAHAI